MSSLLSLSAFDGIGSFFGGGDVETPARGGGGFLDDLIDAFDDEEVLGASKVIGNDEIEPPFVDLQSTRGLVVKFELKGPEDAPKLLYIPGSTDDLRKTISNLHLEAFSKNFRTLTCDLRNQGQTTPRVADKYVPLDTYVDDLLSLVDTAFGADVAFHVVGWSFGAAVALLLARLHPERVHTLVVLGGGYFEQQKEHIGSLSPGGEALFGQDWKWIKTLSAYAELGTEERCQQMLYHADGRRADVAHRESMVPPFEWHLENFVRSEDTTVMKSPRSAKELGEGVLVMEIAMYAEGTTDVEDISTPTIIIHGRHDGMHSVERAVSLKKRMNSAMLVILEDEGHVIVTAAADIAHSFLQPQSNVHPCLQNMKALTIACANAALEEISASYLKESFQRQMDAVFEKSDISEEEKLSECHQLCLQVQGLILAKYSVPRDQKCDQVVDLMRRRLATLEKMAVVDRKKSYDKKVADNRQSKRSEIYLHKGSSKLDAKVDPEDFLRRAVQMQAQPKNVRPVTDNADPEGEYIRRTVEMRSTTAPKISSKGAGLIAEAGGGGDSKFVQDPEEYIRRALQMRAMQQKIGYRNAGRVADASYVVSSW